jgi:hypothetical protein
MSYSYIFQGSNIGTFGVTSDTIDIPEMMFLITKKIFGIPNTIPDIIYSSEVVPNNNTKIPNSFPNIFQNKMYTQNVPIPNPIGTINGGILIQANTYRDLTFSNFNSQRFYNQVLCNENRSSKWISRDYPYICFYSNLQLTNYNPGNRMGIPTASLYSNYTTTFMHPLLINSIPQTYDISYYPRLYSLNGTTEIQPANGYWLVDTDSGLLTFYDRIGNNSIRPSPSNLPRMSFYRYEGLFGEAGIHNSTQDFL